MLIYSILVTVFLLVAIWWIVFHIKSSSSKISSNNLPDENLKLKEQLSRLDEKVKSFTNEKQLLEAEKIKLEEKNKKVWQMSESVYKEKREVDEQNAILLTEKEKLEFEKKKVDEKIKKLWSQSIAVHKEMEHINELKIEVENKHQEVMDSVHYAKRIQNAMLKEQEHVSPHLPKHFVLFKPKDIVSGDFYWALEKQNYWYVAAADCTGHGVPGAFLTMLGTSFLNEINSTPALLTPSEILNLLRARIIKELGQTGKSGESKDGMDISLIMLNLETNEMQWAGANNSLYLISNGELTETKADKQPIGWADNLKPFTNHTFPLKNDDAIYIFSDGFADQFGGPNGRKFMSKHMKETFVSISYLGMSEQKENLNETFESWKGALQQIDDVCVICVKV